MVPDVSPRRTPVPMAARSRIDVPRIVIEVYQRNEPKRSGILPNFLVRNGVPAYSAIIPCGTPIPSEPTTTPAVGRHAERARRCAGVPSPVAQPVIVRAVKNMTSLVWPLPTRACWFPTWLRRASTPR